MLHCFVSKNKIPSVNPWTLFPLLLFSKNPELSIFLVSLFSPSILSWILSSQIVVSTYPWILLWPVSPVTSTLSHQMIPAWSSPYLASYQHLAQLITPSFSKLFFPLAFGKPLSIYLTGHYFFSLARFSSPSLPLILQSSRIQSSNLSFFLSSLIF